MTPPVPGSSPRVRGTRREADFALGSLRFIPACAGNAIQWVGTNTNVAVHPRVCGEREVSSAVQDYAHGSSPRVRGTRRGCRGAWGGSRFIPACAGNAYAPTEPKPYSPVHPRVCGERAPELIEGIEQDGSSPRVRGTPAEASVTAAITRFIPACAGNARRLTHPARRAAVHPRVCGERSASVTTDRYVVGSSPRVRGTHSGDVA